jgi:uncharacterized membrane protein
VIITAISMLMLLSAVALSVDIGDLIWRQRQLQGIVDLGSLDAVRALGDQRDTSQTRCGQALAIARQSAAKNNFTYSASGFSLQVQLGTVSQTTRAWSMLTDCTSNLNPSAANAVKVIALRPVLFSWLPGSDNVLASGISSTVAEADLGMGTWAARVNTTYLSQYDKLMYCLGRGGGTCSSTSGLTAVGYSGLASATINLGSLFSSLSIGTTDQIANTQVSYKSMLQAAATILNAQGGATNVNAATALTSLAGAADSTLKFKFGDIIDSSSGYDSVAAANMNVSELIGASAEIANKAHLVQVNNLGLSIPGVSSFNMKMSVIEAPKWDFGAVDKPVSVHTAQIRTQYEMSVGSVLVGLTSVPITLKLYVESANGTGTLTNIACASNPANGSVTANATTSAVTIYVGEVSDSSMTNVSVDPTPSANVMANVANLVRITGSGSLSLAGAHNASVTLSGPFTRTGTIGTFTTNTDLLRNSLTVTVTSLGGLINTSLISTAVQNLVKPVLDVVDTTLLNVVDILPGLSVDLAGADLWNTRVDCAGRKLVG